MMSESCSVESSIHHCTSCPPTVRIHRVEDACPYSPSSTLGLKGTFTPSSKQQILFIFTLDLFSFVHMYSGFVVYSLFHKYVSCLLLSARPPERRHGYDPQFHSVTGQAEHEALEAKRPRMETITESHINRTPPAAGGVVLPMPHTVQDSLRATVEVRKVGRNVCLACSCLPFWLLLNPG
ncbi:hypothetical protein XENOCAPTIV_018278 [Xenoophorus captivus]|uniref:Uncharacterized protein n=1 Tax=Xenoophorus captivus TaxID=1517983 RepID=A0ABV0S1R1_9TELE